LRDREAGFRFKTYAPVVMPRRLSVVEAVLALARIQDIFLMANTRSAKKAVRKIERRADVNRSRRSQMRTYVRKVEEAIAEGDPGTAAAALRAAQPLVMRAAQKGIVHAKAAARKISRLSKRVNALSK
jgi:small subunit ribosomal protein S20